MDRFCVFVDAGYLLAAGGEAFCGSIARVDVACDYEPLIRAVEEWAADHCRLPLLRTYWYDASKDAVPTLDQLRIANLPNVKLRLGRLSGGKQKGVDSLIIRDLMTLARERAIAAAFLIGGDEDLREGVVEAQDLGVRVAVMGITTAQGNQALTLTREADERITLDSTFWAPFFRSAASATGPATLPLPLPPNPEAARSLGASFGNEWASQAAPGEVEGLLAQSPRIPVDLDVALIRSAEITLGPLHERQDLKRDLRAAFWAAVNELRTRSTTVPGGEPAVTAGEELPPRV